MPVPLPTKVNDVKSLGHELYAYPTPGVFGKEFGID
jgi:hypothetical protein